MRSSRSRRRPTAGTTAALTGAVLSAVGFLAIGATLRAAPVHADEVAYLLNVTVRPGYNFASAGDALAYGHGICERIAGGTAYGDLISDVKAHFANTDEFQASYLVSQAANEICPAQIWQLRTSAAGYQPPPL
ncbi:DUF732 domain-containing protein [Mycolicibacterium sp. YH-1]|uniref:DUF732 domain-containing protein n=1 Tax=Mycolicibacterium sp. YH-1 TaxID=2908837 RepID=UPI001F4BD785|nr:DUF732 domain-containing protein [Mycolicibacterium sp. YH-1]UNB52536.1 DUF732 domain-containing protein [Mycolicibacterium sp. YH-1]